VKFNFGDFYDNLFRNSKISLKSDKKISELSIVAGDMGWTQNRCCAILNIVVLLRDM
jgi:hypothetical protein